MKKITRQPHTNRRTFIKSAAALAGAATLGLPLRAKAADAELDADFVGPWGVCYADNGDLYVTDPGAYHVLVFAPNGQTKNVFGKPGSKDGCLNFPTGIQVAGSEVLVADTNNGRIALFNRRGEWTGALGSLGIATAKLAAPNGVFAGDRWIWVANTRGHVVQRYDWSSRRLDRAFGVLGDDAQPPAPGALDFTLRQPTAVVTDAYGRVYVLDSKHARIVALDMEGRVQWIVAPQADGRGLLRPQAMTINVDTLLLADTGNHRLLKLDLTGRVLAARDGITDPHGLSWFGGKIAVAQRSGRAVRIIDGF